MTVPAVVALVAVPLNAPTNVVAVILALARLAVILEFTTCCDQPFDAEVTNVGNTLVALEVLVNRLLAEAAFATVPVTFAPGIFDKLVALPLKILAVIVPEVTVTLPALIFPDTINEVNEPTLVMFG